VLQHQHAVGAGQAMAPPDPPSPEMVAIIGVPSSGALGRAGDASDWPRSSASMPESAGRVDEGQHRQMNLLRQIHQTHRLR